MKKAILSILVLLLLFTTGCSFVSSFEEKIWDFFLENEIAAEIYEVESFDPNELESEGAKPLPPPEETSFDINDYKVELSAFSTPNLYVGPIKDAEDAATKADAVFKERYDESSLERQRPYVVLYDEESDVWFIHGKWPETYFGGFAYMFVQGKDGKVLAVWHDL